MKGDYRDRNLSLNLLNYSSTAT